MSNQPWALLTICQMLTATGYKIVITTDVACHLWMRWTTIVPQEHLVPIEKRGIYLHADKYFCFVAYEDNEQEEVGDTLWHTFIKEPWPVCQTRYFYFHGTIGAVASPSTSPIFTKHRPKHFLAQLHTDSFVAACFWHPDYNTAWTHPGFNTTSDPVFIFNLQRTANAVSWHIIRAAFVFDTQALPATAIIKSAILHLHLDTYWGTNPGNLYLLRDPGVTLPSIPQNYGTLINATTPIATFEKSRFTTSGWYCIPIPPNNLNIITKEGLTIIASRCSWDIRGEPHDYQVQRDVGWSIDNRVIPSVKPYLAITLE